MKEIGFEELKKVELDILKDVAAFCDEYGITYFVAYGTLIGAVRHNGFIPWDDDIDIWMPRADYNKFLEIYNEKKKTEYYKLISPYEKRARHTFVKVIDERTAKIESNIDYSNGYIGVDIDVFPLDGQPSDENVFDAWYKRLQKEYRKTPLLVGLGKANIKQKIAYPVMRLFAGKMKTLLDNAARIHAEYPYDSSEYVGCVESRYNSKKNRYKKEWFSQAVSVRFEDTEFKIPCGYHEVLTAMYGDYMQLPPEDKQVTHHKNNAFWLED